MINFLCENENHLQRDSITVRGKRRERIMRMTKNREKVYNEILNSLVPVTAYDVSEKLSEISLTTVYRALEYLYENGFVKKFSLDDYTYYYSSSVHRHFFRCVNCGRLYPIEDCYMEEYEKYLSKTFGFRIEEHFVLFSGLCGTCNEESKIKNSVTQ